MLTTRQFGQKYNIIRSYDIVPVRVGVNKERHHCDAIDTNGNGQADFTTWSRETPDGGTRTRRYNQEPILETPLSSLKAVAEESGADIVMEEGNSPEDPNYLRFHVRDMEVIEDSEGYNQTSLATGRRLAQDDYLSYMSMSPLSAAREDKTPLLPLNMAGEDAFYAIDVKNNQFLIAAPRDC